MGGSNGDQILAKAEKKSSSSVGWFGSASSKWEEAGDLFQQVRVDSVCVCYDGLRCFGLEF